MNTTKQIAGITKIIGFQVIQKNSAIIKREAQKLWRTKMPVRTVIINKAHSQENQQQREELINLPKFSENKYH